MANALNPQIHYECRDICASSKAGRVYDVVTLIEVLEHIEIEQVDDFISACANHLCPNGKLILTVPHKNKILQTKHYQHFDSLKIREILAEHFDVERIVFFDKMSTLWARLIAPLFGNFLFILNNRFLLRLLYGLYQKFFFRSNEKKCGRLCIIAHKND
jgi:hypothetical protein